MKVEGEIFAGGNYMIMGDADFHRNWTTHFSGDCYRCRVSIVGNSHFTKNALSRWNGREIPDENVLCEIRLFLPQIRVLLMDLASDFILHP